MALSVVYFQFTHLLGRPHYVWDEYLYSVWEKVEVKVTVSVTVCVMLLYCVEWWWKEGRRWNPVPTHSLLLSKNTKGAARFNVPIRRTNRYQLYCMPSQHTYCGRVWNLIQDCDVQSSNEKMYISTPPGKVQICGSNCDKYKWQSCMYACMYVEKAHSTVDSDSSVGWGR